MTDECNQYQSVPNGQFWAGFSKRFPFGDLLSSQGNYQNSVRNALEELPSGERETLMDLLDLQWVTYFEQLSILSSNNLVSGLAGLLDTVMARLQIHSNLRSEHGLRRRDMRRALMQIAPGDLLTKIEK